MLVHIFDDNMDFFDATEKAEQCHFQRLDFECNIKLLVLFKGLGHSITF